MYKNPFSRRENKKKGVAVMLIKRRAKESTKKGEYILTQKETKLKRDLNTYFRLLRRIKIHNKAGV